MLNCDPMNPIDKRIALDKFPLRMAARSSTPPATLHSPESTHGLDAALHRGRRAQVLLFYIVILRFALNSRANPRIMAFPTSQ
jgi:hypothetical protein